MVNNQHRQGGPEFKSAPMITAAALIGAGAALAIVGFAVGGSHLAQCMRRWVNEMEVSPGERARMALAQAKAAAAAGAEAWQKLPQQNLKR